MRKYYDENNQLRNASISRILSYWLTFPDYCVNDTLKEALLKESKELMDVYHSRRGSGKKIKPYVKMPDGGKIAFVHRLEESVVEVLQTIAKYAEQKNSDI